MKPRLLIIILVALTSEITAENHTSIKTENLSRRITESIYYDHKIRFAEILGEKQTLAAKESLIILLQDKSYWNRTASAAGLLHFDDKRIITCLKQFLNENYTPRKEDGWDVFFTHITFGITATFDYLSERKKNPTKNKSV